MSLSKTKMPSSLDFIINVFLHIFKVNDTININFNISLGIHISKHSCNAHRLKANLLLNLFCISINTSTKPKYTHPDTGLTRFDKKYDHECLQFYS